MGYKKLDEIMELLTDELDGFNKALDRLEKLTKDTDNIEIKTDTSHIEYLLKEHLNSEKGKNSRIHESILDLEKQISMARIIPKTQLWIHHSIWLISLIIIGYLTFKVSRIGSIQEKAYSKGKQQIISNLRRYFDQNPDHYESYQKWINKRDSVSNQK